MLCFPMALFHLISLVSVNLSMNYFPIMCHRYINCLFQMLSKCSCFASNFSKTTLFFTLMLFSASSFRSKFLFHQPSSSSANGLPHGVSILDKSSVLIVYKEIYMFLNNLLRFRSHLSLSKYAFSFRCRIFRPLLKTLHRYLNILLAGFWCVHFLCGM